MIQIRDLQRAFVILEANPHASARELAHDLRVSRYTGYRILEKWKAAKVTGTQDVEGAACVALLLSEYERSIFNRLLAEEKESTTAKQMIRRLVREEARRRGWGE